MREEVFLRRHGIDARARSVERFSGTHASEITSGKAKTVAVAVDGG
jgi:hypothetical protein